jgi:hypothetical protein
MTALDRLRQAIEQHQQHLRAAVPADRASAILALIRAQDGERQASSDAEQPPDMVSGRRRANLGGNRALQLCLEAAEDGASAGTAAPAAGWDAWAERFREQGSRLAEVELVLAHGETGFMQVADPSTSSGQVGHGAFDAWIATKRAPTSWRERADVDWWASWLARRHAPELAALQADRPAPEADGPATDAFYRRLGAIYVEMLAYQIGYPADAVLGGCTVQTYREILARLIGWALQARDRGEAPAPRSERALVAALASAVGGDPAVLGEALRAFTLDQDSAAYHAAVPGVAAAPLVRIDADRLAWSVHGLTTEPLLFLTRELRRRFGQEYHNSAFRREAVFRQELYALFQDRRFVTSTGRIELRREGGDVRTDVDAVVFDRKSGTLGLFELKSQDPFARSTAELTRQRDNVLYANRQISGVLAWIQRHGADTLLARVDARAARTFRAQKVYPFVLGRYLAHFNDGPEPDRRAAWGTWPQLLRLLDGQPVRATDANPLASLFARLTNDPSPIRPPADGPAREIELGAVRLTVHPSYAAFRASTSSGRG